MSLCTLMKVKCNNGLLNACCYVASKQHTAKILTGRPAGWVSTNRASVEKFQNAQKLDYGFVINFFYLSSVFFSPPPFLFFNLKLLPDYFWAAISSRFLLPSCLAPAFRLSPRRTALSIKSCSHSPSPLTYRRVVAMCAMSEPHAQSVNLFLIIVKKLPGYCLSVNTG